MPGKPIAVTRSFFDSIVTAVFSSFSMSISFLTITLFVVFIGILTYLLIKTKGKNDYGWIYIIFISVSLISNILLGRGYPLSREMLPFYPVIVFVVAEGLDCMKPGKITRSLCILAGSLLCFQFFIQIDVTGTRDWREDYRRRSEILHFLAAKGPGAEANGTVQEKLNNYLEANPSSVGMFYLKKLTRILDEETGISE
ncbi:MAG: hypothetical protein LBG14_05910 [Treponema sp.]|jgi:phosphoglycerol transferase MdoB-like AlkP superfamily enzyme|nr:hypothetical protein [Treponema sp.]